MAGKEEATLEKKVGELEKLMKPEKAMEREDLAASVSEAFRASLNKWLIKKHGSHKLPDGTEVPLKYSIGDYDKEKREYKFLMRDVDDILDYASENMLSYVFNDIYKKNPENFKAVSKAIKDAGLLQGILQSKFGIHIDKLKENMTKTPHNIFNEEVEKTLSFAGAKFATAEIERVQQEVLKYGFDLKEKFYGIAEKEFGKKGYGIETKGMKPEEVVQHLGKLYGGAYEPEKVPGSKVYKKKS